jgi:hypothetical protein
LKALVSCETFCSKAWDLKIAEKAYSPNRAFEHLLPETVKKLKSFGFEKEGVVCSDVITWCLDPGLVRQMHEWLTRIFPNKPGVSFEDAVGILMSPNGLSFALGLPHAKTITYPGVELTPNLLFLPPPAAQTTETTSRASA